MVKELKDYTFEELIDQATRDAHDGLLREGGKGLRSSIYTWGMNVIRWRADLEKEANKGKKKK